LGKWLIKAIVGVITGVANGLFGSGGGTILVPALEKIMKVETHKAHATALAVIFPLSLLSICIYMRGSKLPWLEVGCICLGGVAGGFLGAYLLNKIKAVWLHKIFGLFLAAAAVKMIFWS